jgi:4'-phosphopantetheinyl transferase
LKAEVHVWRAELDAPGWPGTEGLPAAERERSEQMLRPGVASRWVAARWALRHVLARYLDEEPAGIELGPGPHGKPQLAADSGRLRFNLSHSGELALIAVCAEREVGVDCERVERERDCLALAERALSPADVEAVRTAPAAERPAVFHRLWVRHEARLKCLGVGLSQGNRAAGEPIAVGDLKIDASYAAAVAVAAPELPELQQWTLGPPLPNDG